MLQVRMLEECKQHLMKALDLPEARMNLAYLAIRHHEYIDQEAIENAKILAGFEGMGGQPALLSAKVLSLANERDLAIDCLKLASARGILADADQLQQSPDYKNLRDHPNFLLLLETHQPIETAHPLDFYVHPDDF